MAIVTGANKGIGLSLVKKLAEMGLTVILTARDIEKGNKAVEILRNHGLYVHFYRLDVSDPASIKDFVLWFQKDFGVLDILVSLFVFFSLFLLMTKNPICLCDESHNH